MAASVLKPISFLNRRGSKNSPALLRRLVFLVLLSLGPVLSGGRVGAEQLSASGETSGKVRKILWVDSYHREYEWSAGIEQGIRQVLAKANVELRIVRMDTKRTPAEKDKRAAALRAREAIEKFRPDVVIASDDNAVKYLVVPYLKNTALPVVFCGVNWDAALYGLPDGNVAGMVEVDLVETQIMHLSRYARGARIGYLSGDTETERKIIDIYNRRFFNGCLKSYLVTTFADFQKQFLRAQQEVDMLYIYNYAGIADWDPVRAETFLLRNVRIPTGSHNPFMAPYVLVAVAKLPEEQGEWAARSALRILGGVDPADIPAVRNERGRLIVNLRMAEALGIVFPVDTLRAAEVIGQGALH
jgi:ABC-type uncharacterized transport system substrate-binding protein